MPRRKQDSESENQSNAKRQKGEDCEDVVEEEAEWTTEEKEILLVELERKGWKNLEWSGLQQRLKTKTEDQIKKLSAQLKVQRQVIESTTMDAKETSPLQVWTEFANQVTDPADTIAAQCIPQVMAVASLEERRYVDMSGNLCPDFQKIYSFLANLLKGEANIDQLRPLDAMVILEFMDDIESNLKDSYVDLQMENVMKKYNALPRKGKEMLYRAILSTIPNNGSPGVRGGVSNCTGNKSSSNENTHSAQSQTVKLSESSTLSSKSSEEFAGKHPTLPGSEHVSIHPKLGSAHLPKDSSVLLGDAEAGVSGKTNLSERPSERVSTIKEADSRIHTEPARVVEKIPVAQRTTPSTQSLLKSPTEDITRHSGTETVGLASTFDRRIQPGNLRPILPREPLPDKGKQESKSSSLNPLKIPVKLLNFKKKDNVTPKVLL